MEGHLVSLGSSLVSPDGGSVLVTGYQAPCLDKLTAMVPIYLVGVCLLCKQAVC